MAVTTVTSEKFETEVLSSEKPVLIDFWAPWCNPCKMAAPIIEAIAGENEGIKVCKVNIDEEPALAERFSIMSIPTFTAVKDGRVVKQISGVHSKAQLISMIQNSGSGV